jgi:hypothetical protein
MFFANFLVYSNNVLVVIFCTINSLRIRRPVRPFGQVIRLLLLRAKTPFVQRFRGPAT